MNAFTSAAAKLSAYNRDSVLSASPARLLTMLYDRLLLDLTRGETALEAEQWPTAWENLRHADQIVADCSELIAKHSLDPANAREVVVRVLLGDQPLPLKGGMLSEQRAGVASPS